jgi:hypothetical protein
VLDELPDEGVLLGVDEVPVPLLDGGVEGGVVAAVAGAAGVVEALSAVSFFGVDVESEDSPVGGFILSE